jgi:hypothetical protein
MKLSPNVPPGLLGLDLVRPPGQDAAQALTGQVMPNHPYGTLLGRERHCSLALSQVRVQ